MHQLFSVYDDVKKKANNPEGFYLSDVMFMNKKYPNYLNLNR